MHGRWMFPLDIKHMWSAEVVPFDHANIEKRVDMCI